MQPSTASAELLGADVAAFPSAAATGDRCFIGIQCIAPANVAARRSRHPGCRFANDVRRRSPPAIIIFCHHQEVGVWSSNPRPCHQWVPGFRHVPWSSGTFVCAKSPGLLSFFSMPVITGDGSSRATQRPPPRSSMQPHCLRGTGPQPHAAIAVGSLQVNRTANHGWSSWADSGSETNLATF